VKSDGTVWAWGGNSSGQLGDGTFTDRVNPVQVSGLSGVVSIAAGEEHSVALKSNGVVMTWGFNGSGQLGDGTGFDSEVPVQPINLCTVLDVEKIDVLPVISIYPNPVNEFLNIQTDNSKNIGWLKIYDPLGRTVLEKYINEKDARVEVRHLPAGVYYLRTEMQGGLNFIKE
jgi:hypothetical protein